MFLLQIAVDISGKNPVSCTANSNRSKKLSHTELQLESLEGSFGLSLHAFHPDEPCLNLTDVNSAAFCEKRVQISKEIMIQ